MQVLGSLVEQLISMLLIIFLGGFLRKKNVINKEITDGLFILAMNIGLPAAVITGMQGTMYSPDTFKMFVVVFAGSVVCMLLGILLSILACIPLKKKFPEKGVWIACTVAPNISFMGIPLFVAIYDESILFLVAASLFAANLIAFSILKQIVSITGENLNRKLTFLERLRPLKNVVLISTLFAFLLYLFSIRLSGPILNTLRMISVTTTPLAMLAIGSTLALVNIKKLIMDYRTYIISLLKLILLPVIGYLILSPFINDRILLGVIIICAALPTGNAIPAMVRSANNDETLASAFVVATTIFSMITIPLIVWAIV